MQTKHARLLFIFSIFLLALVVVDFVRIGDKVSQQNNASKSKVSLTEKVDEIGSVLGGCPSTPMSFSVKDSVTSSVISDATVTSLNTFDSSTNTWTFDSGTNTYFQTFYGLCGTYTFHVSIVKSGYQTNTFDITETAPPPTTVLLVQNTATPTAPTVTNTTTTKTTTTKKTDTKTETIKDVSLPAGFKAAGTATTDLSKIADPAKVDNLTIDSGVNTIKFTQTIDLSATETKDKFKSLDTYVKINKIGIISIDSTNLPALNKAATLTMKLLGFVKTPRILVNGKEDSSIVRLVSYKNGTLIFTVTHFSTFTVAPTVGINEPSNNFETSNKTVTLKGTVSDPSASVSAKLNNKDLGKLKVATNGAFQKDISLENGLNKLVVSALSATGATASASISGTLLAKNAIALLPIYILLLLLAIVAAFGIIWSFKHLKKNADKKAAGTNDTITK